MGSLIVTEYAAQFLGGGYAKFKCDEPLGGQRLAINKEPARSQQFNALTNLVRAQADTACLIEIDNPSVSTELAADGEQFFAVLSTSRMTVIQDNISQETLS